YFRAASPRNGTPRSRHVNGFPRTNLPSHLSTAIHSSPSPSSWSRPSRGVNRPLPRFAFAPGSNGMSADGNKGPGGVIKDMSNRHILYERHGARIEHDTDGACHFVEMLRDRPLYEIPISRWKA